MHAIVVCHFCQLIPETSALSSDRVFARVLSVSNIRLAPPHEAIIFHTIDHIITASRKVMCGKTQGESSKQRNNYQQHFLDKR